MPNPDHSRERHHLECTHVRLLDPQLELPNLHGNRCEVKVPSCSLWSFFVAWCNWMTRQLGLESHKSAMNPNVGSHPVKILLHISWSSIYCLFRTYMHISTSTNLWDFCSVTWDTSKKNWSARTNSSSASSCATTSFHPEVELSTAATSFRKILRWKCKSERMWSFCKTSHKVKWIDPVIYWYKIYQNM